MTCRGRTIGAVIRPGRIREKTPGPIFAWMLNTNKHGLTVRRRHHSGDFTVRWTGKKATSFTADRVGHHHNVTAKVDPIAESVASLISLNPQPSIFIEP